jgi:hypothetical protein
MSLTAPTLTATADNTNARIVLTVTGTHVEATYASVYFVIEFQDTDAVWKVVRGAGHIVGDGTPSPTTFTVYDYESPLGVARHYRAKTVSVV